MFAQSCRDAVDQTRDLLNRCCDAMSWAAPLGSLKKLGVLVESFWRTFHCPNSESTTHHYYKNRT